MLVSTLGSRTLLSLRANARSVVAVATVCGGSGLACEGCATPAEPSSATESARVDISSPIYSAMGPTICIDVPAFATTPGTELELWTCNRGDNQQFHFMPAGEIRVYRASMCLYAAGR